MSDSKKIDSVFVVLACSGIHAGNCIIGAGRSKSSAIADAYGPGGFLPSSHWINEYESMEVAANDLGEKVYSYVIL